MRRILTVVLFITLFPTVSRAQNIPSPAGMWCQYCKPHEDLAGSVRTLLFVEKRDEDPFDTVAETFNAQGKKVESLSHSSGREIHSGQIVRLDSKIIYAYDSKGRLIKEISYSLDKPNQGNDSVLYVYDGNGRLIEETTLNAHGTPSRKAVFTYEPQKRTVVAMTTSYVEGRVIRPFRAVLIYNEKGQWIKKSMFRADASPDGIAQFAYNEKGYLAKEARYDDDGKHISTHVFTYTYDSHGNWYERHEMQTYTDKDGKSVENPDWLVMYRVITYQENR